MAWLMKRKMDLLTPLISKHNVKCSLLMVRNRNIPLFGINYLTNNW